MTFEEWWESHRGTGGSRHTFAFDAWNFQAVKIADLEERIRERDGEWVDAIEDTLHFGIIPETLAGAVECMKAWLEEREARIERVKGLAEKMADLPIPEGTCSNSDQKEGFHDGVCCCYNFLMKGIAALDGETK